MNEMVDRSELASSSCPSPSSLAQDVLTVFQFHHYSVEHDVTDMERHLLDLAKEGKNILLNNDTFFNSINRLIAQF